MRRFTILLFLICFSGCSTLSKGIPEKRTYIKYGDKFLNDQFSISSQRLVLNEAAKKEKAIEDLLNNQIYGIANSLDKTIYPSYRHQFAEGVVKHAKNLHDRFVFKETINREQEIQNEVRTLEKRLESQTSWMSNNNKTLFASYVSNLTNTLLMISERGSGFGSNAKTCLPERLKNLEDESIFTGENKKEALEKIFWKYSKIESENQVLNEKQEIIETSKSEFTLHAEVYACEKSVTIVPIKVVHD